MPKYKLEFSIETKSDPREVVNFIQKRIKDALPVLSMRYELVEDRPTSTEHHGGVTDEGST